MAVPLAAAWFCILALAAIAWPSIAEAGVAKSGWVKIERERYNRGETNYVPCNAWNKVGYPG